MAPGFPPGLESISVRLTPSHIHGTGDVDFDKASAARRRSGASPIPPMMDYLLRGRHTLTVAGQFSAIDGVGQFDLETVALDGVTIPQALVDFLIETYLRPRYRTFDPNRPFRMPHSIDRVQVERERLEVQVQPAMAL
jgi:hypothetical protein